MKIVTDKPVSGSFGLEHPLFQDVLTIAEEFLHQNKAFDAKKLYSIAKRRLDVHRRDLLDIIEYLLEKKILVEGSKLTKELLLLNKYRRAIYDFISKYIGVNFSLIKRNVYSSDTASTGSSGQFIWHIQMLIKFEYIKKVKFKKFTIFIPFNMDPELGIYYFLFRDQISRKIVELLIKEGVFKKADIHKVLNEKRDYIYYRINTLLDSNILSHSEESSREVYLTPERRDIILNVLNNFSEINKNPQ